MQPFLQAVAVGLDGSWNEEKQWALIKNFIFNNVTVAIYRTTKCKETYVCIYLHVYRTNMYTLLVVNVLNARSRKIMAHANRYVSDTPLAFPNPVVALSSL